MLIATSLIVVVTLSMFVALQLNTPVQAQAPVACTIRIVPSVVNAEVCTNFVVDVNIKDFFLWPVYDYEFLLIYPSAEMSPVIAYDGDFLVEPVTFGSDLSTMGQVLCQGYTTAGGATGSGTLASIEFHCEGAGSTPLTLEFIYISDVDQTQFAPDNVIRGFVNQYEPGPVLVYIDPPTYTVPICIPFTVNVMVDDVTDLHSYQLDMSYTNTAVVDCTNVQDAGFIPQPVTEDHKLIDDAAGIIEFDVTSTQPFGADGGGAIAKITFHCTGPGESILNIDRVDLYNSAGVRINTFIGLPGRVIQRAYWEPKDLRELVERWPYPYALVDIPFIPPGSPEGYIDVMAALTDKGFAFDPTEGTAMEVTMFADDEEIHGTVTSWWSNDTLEDGTRACMLSAEMNDGTGMAMGFVTNLLPPEQIPEVDPFIIVNAQPYIFVDFYWWAWSPIGRVVKWPYWWYDSHSHPNWFWGPYWWWRTYTKSYYYPYVDVPYWRPWWGWWWHWTYRQHWYWWSTYFPYIDP